MFYGDNRNQLFVASNTLQKETIHPTCVHHSPYWNISSGVCVLVCTCVRVGAEETERMFLDPFTRPLNASVRWPFPFPSSPSPSYIWFNERRSFSKQPLSLRFIPPPPRAQPRRERMGEGGDGQAVETRQQVMDDCGMRREKANRGGQIICLLQPDHL